MSSNKYQSKTEIKPMFFKLFDVFVQEYDFITDVWFDVVTGIEDYLKKDYVSLTGHIISIYIISVQHHIK